MALRAIFSTQVLTLENGGVLPQGQAEQILRISGSYVSPKVAISTTTNVVQQPHFEISPIFHAKALSRGQPLVTGFEVSSDHPQLPDAIAELVARETLEGSSVMASGAVKKPDPVILIMAR